jgi:CheY-like chemotaxis protein
MPTDTPPIDAPKKKVLWIEDDALMGTVLGAKLSSSGFELVMAKNGEEAMAYLAGGVIPDVIVIDLLLPGMSGFDILAEMAKDPKMVAVPKLVLSNLNQPADWEKVRPFGVRKFLVKTSVSLEQIVGEINALCVS